MMYQISNLKGGERMSLQFVIGGSGAGKTYQLYKNVIESSLKGPKGKYLILVPEQFTLQTQKDLVTMHPKKGIHNIDILSFLRLAYRIFEETGGNDRLVLEDTGKSMIVKKVMMEKRKDLILFGANVKKQGFIEEMKSIISELAQYSIHSEELQRMKEVANGKPLLNHKLTDIMTIYQAYEEFLRDKYINSEEILDLLCDVIEDSSLVNDSDIFLDGFTGFTPSQYKLLSHLMKKAKSVTITITMEESQINRKQEEHQLFYLSGKMMEKLTDLAITERIEIKQPILVAKENGGYSYRFHNSMALSALEKNIFRYPYKPYRKEQEDVTITVAKDPMAEARHAVIEITRLLREEQYRYKDIAIVSGAIEVYGDIVKRELELAGIPCFVDHKKNILANPVVEFLRSALDVVTHNFDYEAVFRFLKCGLTDFSTDEIDLFENYVIAFGIRGKYRYEQEWQKKYRTNYEIDLEKINFVRGCILKVFTPLYETLTDKNSSVRECILSLYDLLCTYHIEEKTNRFIEKFKEHGEDEDKLRAKEYEQIYHMILEIFDRMVELLGEDILPLKEFRDILDTGFREAKVGLIPPSIDQILVGDIERTRLKDIKALFFLGVNDGIVPKANPGGGILSDAERQLFADHEIELSPTKRQTAYLTEFYLYLNLTKPQNKLYLYYSKLDASGKSIRASYLLGKISKIFPELKIYDADRKLREDELLGTDQGLSYLISVLRDYEGEQPKLWKEVYHLYVSGQIKGRISIDRVLQGVFYQNYEQGLTREVARKLYGETLLGSVTRMEKYAACAFAHFLQYGLNLEERQEYKISMPDIGSLFHEALERFGEALKDLGIAWNELPDDIRISLGERCVRETVENFGNGILESSKRSAYLATRVERILQRTTKTLTHQLQQGVFEPGSYEQYFSHADRYLNLRGRIDRVDLYEQDGKLYVKVIDYKSGSTSFDLMSLYYGLQLQLGVYLSAAMELMKEQYPNHEVHPAGVFYYNLDDPIVTKSNSIEEDIEKKLAMNGLVNASKAVVPLLDTSFRGEEGELAPSTKSTVIPVETGKDGTYTKRSSIAKEEDLNALMDYIKDLMHRFSEQIMDGKVRHNPYKAKNRNACAYCSFQSVCGFDCRVNGFSYRILKTLNKDEVWSLMKEEDEFFGKDELDTGTAEGN
jgi:ATP-dependent helicase/nuclease subunit B